MAPIKGDCYVSTFCTHDELVPEPRNPWPRLKGIVTGLPHLHDFLNPCPRNPWPRLKGIVTSLGSRVRPSGSDVPKSMAPIKGDCYIPFLGSAALVAAGPKSMAPIKGDCYGVHAACSTVSMLCPEIHGPD